MTRRMLINARHAEELRVAIVEDGVLDSYQVEVAERGLSKGNIYRGTIANIQPALNAAFIDYGAERHGFLAIQDVVPQAYYREPGKGRPKIEDVLERGMPIVVQVEKESEGQKGAVLTTNLSLAGRYLVFTPFDDTRGVSRKVEDEATRARLRQAMRGLEAPPGSGLIVRTNALDQNKATLARDLASLLRLWKGIETQAIKGDGIRQLYSDQDLLLRALRDHLDTSVEEILVDDEETFTTAEHYLRALMPRGKTRLVHYRERMPLFSRYEVERLIEAIYERSVPLQGGGSIVLDKTEALTAIDVNSGRSTKGANQEETALHTNVQAAKEVARQIRLRDVGGLIVVDFIDMRSMKGRKKVEKELREAMKADRARSTVGRISQNGLLEINRQRIQQALHLRTHQPCPACGGTGRVPSPDAAALGILRRIEARAAVGDLEAVKVALHPDIAHALRARKEEIQEIERDLSVRIEVTASGRLERSENAFEWVKPPHGAPPRPEEPPPEPVGPTILLVEDEMGVEDFDEPVDEVSGEDGSEAQAALPLSAGSPPGADKRAGRRRGRRGGRGRKRGGPSSGSVPPPVAV
jgi:ribonuclease E